MSYKGSRHQRREYAVAAPHLLVHDKKDTVGVVLVEGLKAGTDMLGVLTQDNLDFRLNARHDVPISHKVALVDSRTATRSGNRARTSVAPSPTSEKASTSTCTM